MRFTEDQIEEAKSVDLYDFILSNPEFEYDFEVQGNSLRREDTDENGEKVRIISVKRNSNFYIDWITMQGGDTIDFLRKLYGYTFPEAVRALRSEALLNKKIIKPEKKERTETVGEKEIQIPLKGTESRHVYAYLTKTRCIPGDTVNMLMRNGLLYEDDKRNAVFISRNRDRVEIRGTNSDAEKKFCLTDYVHKDDCWYFGKGDTVYITEGAIDAISLYELFGRKPAVYASLPGVGNQVIVDRIAKGKLDVILAVDNDFSGKIRRACNLNLKHLIPPEPYLDWNEMLQKGVTDWNMAEREDDEWALPVFSYVTHSDEESENRGDGSPKEEPPANLGREERIERIRQNYRSLEPDAQKRIRELIKSCGGKLDDLDDEGMAKVEKAVLEETGQHVT